MLYVCFCVLSLSHYCIESFVLFHCMPVRLLQRNLIDLISFLPRLIFLFTNYTFTYRKRRHDYGVTVAEAIELCRERDKAWGSP